LEKTRNQTQVCNNFSFIPLLYPAKNQTDIFWIKSWAGPDWLAYTRLNLSTGSPSKKKEEHKYI